MCKHTYTHSYTVEHNSAVKKIEIRPFAATWMQLVVAKGNQEIIILSQKEKNKCNIISLTREI